MTLASASVVQVAANACAALLATVLLGAADRGVMVLGSTIASVAAIIGNLGTSAALRRHLPSTVGPARRDLLVAYRSCSAAGCVLACIVALSAAIASSGVIDRGLAAPVFLVAVGLFTVEQCMVLQTTEAWFADGDFRRGGSSGALIIGASVVGLLAAASISTTPAALLLGQGLGGVLAWCSHSTALRRAGLWRAGRLRRHWIRALVSGGVPTLGATLGLALALRSDRWILGVTTGTAAVGVYSLAATVSEVSRMAPQAFGQMFLRDVATGGAGRKSLTTTLTGATAMSAVGGLVVAAVSWVAVEPLFGPEFAGAAVLVVILVVAETCFAPYAITSRGLLGGGWVLSAGALGVVGSIAAPMLYFVGARWHDSVGLALACVIVYSALSCAATSLFVRRSRNQPEVLEAAR